MCRYFSAKNKEFNAKQDKLSDGLDDAKKVISDRHLKTMEMVRKIAIAAQGLHAMMQKITVETTEDGLPHDVLPFAMKVESAVDVGDMLATFNKLLTRSPLLEVAEDQATSTEAGEEPYRNVAKVPILALTSTRRSFVRSESSFEDLSLVSGSDSDEE